MCRHGSSGSNSSLVLWSTQSITVTLSALHIFLQILLLFLLHTQHLFSVCGLLSLSVFLPNTLQHKVLEPIPPTQEAFVGGCALECEKKNSERVKVICFIAGSGRACLMTFKAVELKSRECVNCSQTRERYLCGSWNKCIQADLTCQAVSYCSLACLNGVKNYFLKSYIF